MSDPLSGTPTERLAALAATCHLRDSRIRQDLAEIAASLDPTTQLLLYRLPPWEEMIHLRAWLNHHLKSNERARKFYHLKRQRQGLTTIPRQRANPYEPPAPLEDFMASYVPPFKADITRQLEEFDKPQPTKPPPDTDDDLFKE